MRALIFLVPGGVIALAFGPGRLGRRFGEWLHFHTTEFIEETPDA